MKWLNVTMLVFLSVGGYEKNFTLWGGIKMNDISKSLKYNINQQLTKLNEEEHNLNNYYEGRMRVANDGYYVQCARSKAKKEALNAQKRIDEIINRKIELANQLRSL